MGTEERDGATKKRKKRAKGRTEVEAKKKAEEADLQSFLFGASEDALSRQYGRELDEAEVSEDEGQKGSGDEGEFDREADGVGREGGGEEIERRRPAWVDEEEATAVVNIAGVNRLRKLRREAGETLVSGADYVSRLRAQHAVLARGAGWAELPSEKREKGGEDSEQDSDSESEDGGGQSLVDRPALLENGELVVKSRSRLSPGIIEMTAMRDGNAEEPSNAVVRSVEFHRNAQILMTAGFDKRLRFFQVDGKKNPKMQSIFLDDFPVYKAAFVPDGSRVIAAGRRNFYYLYDLAAGRVDRISPLIGRSERTLESFEVCPDGKHVTFLGNEGYILLCSLATKQWVANLKMNGSVRSVAFAMGGRHLISTGEDGEIYHWDLRTRRCFHRGRDDGNLTITSLTASPDDRLLATGSKSGLVSVYDRDEFIGGVSRPIKIFGNLLTTVDNLKFNCDSQILAMTSKLKKNALRLVHLPSYTVFSNWPRQRAPLQHVHSLDFSPGGGYMAVGNAGGRVLLYRLRHYDHA